MKYYNKLLKILIITFIVLGLGHITQAYDYEYKNLDISANIKIDGTIDIAENFDTYFNTSKHGIIRFIPLNYSVDGKNFHINIDNIYVQGNKFSKSTNNGTVEIKIGDANKTVIGKKKYQISYSTYGLIKNFSGMGYAELYRNLVGYDFDTTIDKVRAELILPKIYTGFTKDDFLITTDGKTNTIDKFEGIVDFSQGDRIVIIYNKKLPIYQGITLAIKFPNNYFEFNHKKQKKLVGKINDAKQSNSSNVFKNINPHILKVIFIYILGLLISYLKINGLSFKKKPIVTKYEPPKGLKPREVGYLYYRKFKKSQAISLVYYYISLGYISLSTKNNVTKIKILNKDKLDKITLSTFGNNIPSDGFNTGIGRLLSKNDNIYKWTKRIYEKGSSGAVVESNCPRIWIRLMLILTCGCFFLGTPLDDMIAIMFFGTTVHKIGTNILIYFIAGFLCMIPMCITRKLPLSEKGINLRNEVLGFRKFIQYCDSNQLKLLLDQDPNYCNKILPYAIALGFNHKVLLKIINLGKDYNLESLDFNLNDLNYVNFKIHPKFAPIYHSASQHHSKYSSGIGFDSGSSFSGGGSSFSSGGGGGGGGSSSW